LMSAAGGGAMAAVLGCDSEQVQEILAQHGLLGLDVANYNTPSQVVLAGPEADVARAEDVFVAAGATFIPLQNVSAAFHSRYMESAMRPLAEELAAATFSAAKIPVISNVSGRPHAAQEVKELLERQLREPVQWTESIRFLLGAGVVGFEEVGPGGVLTKLIKSIRRSSAPSPAAGAADRLGAASFRRDHKVRRAYVAGAMERGIASQDLVIRLGKAGYLGVFGAAGLELPEIDRALRSIRSSLGPRGVFGVGLRSSPDDPALEMEVVRLCLAQGVGCLEASGFVGASSALVLYRLKGLREMGDGRLQTAHKVIARVARPDVAEAFLLPAPEHLVADLARAGLLTADEAGRAGRVPLADDLCVEPGSAGSGDSGSLALLLPAIVRRRDEVCKHRGYEIEVRVGGGGEIGTPEAAAAAFLLGADFILTGSVNQCTVEAGTSEDVKTLLQAMDVHDTDLVPAGDLFELGAKVRVLKKGVSFPARANRLYDLWRHHGAWEEIDAATRTRIERDYLGGGFEQIFDGPVRNAPEISSAEVERAQGDPRHKMALVFRWYILQAQHLALGGAREQRANYHVPCGPDLGAFNQWAKGTRLESWRDRHADEIADELLEGAARVLSRELRRLAP
ncbi:MAG TPA: hypothetical protein DD490_32905, partial [Acidobacteria bacterium]|nr:hypothetical protein [Acidobacteriota bacterium]